MRSRLAFRERVAVSAIRVSASRLSSMLVILPCSRLGKKNGAPQRSAVLGRNRLGPLVGSAVRFRLADRASFLRRGLIAGALVFRSHLLELARFLHQLFSRTR